MIYTRKSPKKMAHRCNLGSEMHTGLRGARTVYIPETRTVWISTGGPYSDGRVGISRRNSLRRLCFVTLQTCANLLARNRISTYFGRILQIRPGFCGSEYFPMYHTSCIQFRTDWRYVDGYNRWEFSGSPPPGESPLESVRLYNTPNPAIRPQI